LPRFLHRGLCYEESVAAGDGTVFDKSEAAILEKGRDLQTQVLTEAVARRVEAAEKKGAEGDSWRHNTPPENFAAPSTVLCKIGID